MLTSDEDIYIAVLATSVVMLVLVGIIVVAVVMYQRRYRRNLEEVFRIRQAFEKELLASRLEISEETLNKVSREVHDNLGQLLSVVKLNLHSFIAQLNPDGKELVKETKDIVDRVIGDLRHLSRTLNSEYLQRQTLRQWLASETDILRKSGTYQVDFVVEGEDVEIDPQRKVLLIRIFQEGLNNVLRHAAATSIAVRVYFREHHVTLELIDNGKGFDPDVIPRGIGLDSMHHRASLIGATLQLSSQPGKGSTLALDIPYESATHTLNR